MKTRSARPDSRSSFRQRGKLLVARLFPERQLVLRTGMRRRCFTVATEMQAAVAAVAAGTVLWQGVVTTQWLYSAATIAYKDREIVDLRLDREVAIASKSRSESRFRGLAGRISSEIDDIQRNLALLARHDSMTSKPVAAYSIATGGAATADAGTALGRTLDEKLTRLEQSLSTLKSAHSELLATSAQTASAQLHRLESALATVGVDSDTLVADAFQLCADTTGEPAARDDGGGPSRMGLFLPTKYAHGKHEASPAALHATMQRWNDVVFAMRNLPLGTPVEHTRITSRFGRRADPLSRRQAVHHGIDFGGFANSPVLATGGGVVSYSNRNGRYGKMVEIDHGNGYFTRYAHLAEISVKVGQEVERGTEIGLVGSTGRSTGPHLHYELRVGNEPRDPLKFIGVGKNVFQRNSEGSKG